MKFGPMFRKWIQTFHSSITSCVMNNGHASDFFQLYRGVRQGCPLSGLPFVLAIEVLAQAIRENENIHGLKINNTELKLRMYADDLTAFIKDERLASHLFGLLNDFGTCSGLKINLSKTEGMWLGSLKCHFSWANTLRLTSHGQNNMYLHYVSLSPMTPPLVTKSTSRRSLLC